MMSAYIKYKDITFSDSGENCCSLVENFGNGIEEFDSLESEKNYVGGSSKMNKNKKD